MPKKTKLLETLNRRKWSALVSFISVISASVVYLLLVPPTYQVSGRLILENKKVGVSEIGRELSQKSPDTPGGPSPVANQAEIIRSQPLLERALLKISPERINSSENEQIINKLRQNLWVKIIPATDILEVSYRDKDPFAANKLLNSILDSVVEHNTESVRAEAKATREFLEGELPKRLVEVKAAEVAESKYRRLSAIISFDEQAKSLVESMANIDNEQSLVLAQLQEAKARSQALQQVTGTRTAKQALVVGRISRSEELSSLRGKLTEVESELAIQRSRYQEESPTILSLLDRRNKLRNLYEQQATNQLFGDNSVNPSNIPTDELSSSLGSEYISSEIESSALEEKLSALRSEQARLQKILTQLPILQQPLTNLVRQREAATATLNLLKGKLEEARIAEAQQLGNIQIVERSQVPVKPTSPNKKATLLIAVVFGVVLAGITVLGLEIIDNKLEITKVENVFDVPILGVLPEISTSKVDFEHNKHLLEHLDVVEPYIHLLKKIDLHVGKSSTVITLSNSTSYDSIVPILIHLGIISSLFSRNVLIIDTNKKYSLNNSFLKVHNDQGLAEVINQKISFEHAVQKTKYQNLSVLSSGDLTKYPISEFSREQIYLLLQKARQNYDLILVNTSATSDHGNARLAKVMSDGLVIVAQLHQTTEEQLRQSIQTVRNDDISLLGVIISGINPQTIFENKLNSSVRQLSEYDLSEYQKLDDLTVGQKVNSCNGHVRKFQKTL